MTTDPKRIYVEGYDAAIVADAASLPAGVGQQRTKVNGYDALVVTGPPGLPLNGYPTADTYAELPDASASTGQIYAVLTTTGTWPLQNKAGLYQSNGSTWKYYSANPSVSLWDSGYSYAVDQMCVGSDGSLYKSTTPANQGNDPVTDRDNWEKCPSKLTFKVENQTGGLLAKGTVIYPDPATIIGKADAFVKDKSRLILVLEEDIANGSKGYGLKLGYLEGIDTSMFTNPGQIAYLGRDGEITPTKPDDGGYVITVGVIESVDAVNGAITVDTSESEITVEVTDTNGFPSDERSNTNLAFTNLTRTLSITADTYPYHYYVTGDKFEKSALDSVVITDVEGRHYVYYDDETLVAVANPSLGEVDIIIRTKSLVCSLYWNATDKEIVGAINDERHGISMSPDTHSYLHFTQGAKFLSGLGIGDIDADNNSPDDASGQFSVASGFTADEDLITVYQNKVSTGGLPIYYLDGANGYARRTLETGFSVLTDITAGTGVTGRLVFNEYTGATWQLSTVSSGNYVLCHVFAVNGTGISNGDEETDQQVAVIGQNEYSSAADARLGATTEISDITSGLAQNELVAIATLIFETKDNYTGSSVLARVVSTADGDYTDWRTSELQSGSGASSHTNLTNVDAAAPGIIQGHINDQAQTIGGKKTFSDSINLETLPTSSSGLSTGDLYTQTATQIGGSGTTKVVCIV